ncbi:CIC11C00000005269 [Sungouiella intermedia]|uniref:glucan endo-1,3-beta-D-glucosidase n=1 Tax=Sungouiella intermedia TaxID=45354 RepID=A0A1L0D5A6_9ASCO|nr:CIC11C00000005269 [[Candida] intermedia]
MKSSFLLTLTAAIAVLMAASLASQNGQNGPNVQTGAPEEIISGSQTSTVTTSQQTAQGSQVADSNTAVDVIEFENVGYTGYYYDVATLGESSSSCGCALSESFTVFTGSNSPLDEELSVHFRGPLHLEQFAYYTADDSSSGSWSRVSYYNASSQTANNVTFLNNAGEQNSCLGKALTYSSGNGTGSSTSSTILEADNLVESNEEYTIFSSQSCPDSGFNNACGVYRLGIPAYHGFGGTTKMFLFEWTMPQTTTTNKSIDYYDMPAIWFLNAKIPRTSQYSSNSSCSCWNSGCGELDVFEVLNLTTPHKLYATIHDYQGTDSINAGIAASGYFSRSTSSTMKGGVRFGTDGTISIFLLDDLSIDESIDASDVSSWISGAGTEDVKSLSSISMNTSATLSSKKSGSNSVESHGFFSALVTFMVLALLYI